MSEPTPPKRVAVLIGNTFGTVDEADLPKMPKGTRVLSAKEVQAHDQDVAEEATQSRYDALPTAAKVAGGIADAASLLTPGAGALNLGTNPGSHPTAKAYGHGVGEGLTGGLASGATRQAIDATMGHDAGDRYAQNVQQTNDASPIAHGLGSFVGTTAGLVSSAGGAAENLATRGLARAGVEGATSTLGKAGVAAARLGARGAAEGAIIQGGEYAGHELLQDHDLAADKVFASMGTGALYGGGTGVVLGGIGTLAGAGIKAGLSRALTREATDVATGDAALASTAATTPQGKIASLMANPTAGGKRIANELAFDALGATKVQIRNALEHVAGGKEAVGEYVNRTIGSALGENASAWQVGKIGRADDLLGLFQADKAGRIGVGLTDAIKGTPARVDMLGLYRVADDIASRMSKDPTKYAGLDTFRNRVMGEMQAISNTPGRVAADGTIDAADAFYIRSNLAKQAYEVKQVSGAAGDAYKEFLRAMDHSTIEAIDKAAADAGKGGVGDKIRHWKREWQLASAAENAAEGGAERVAGNNFFGLREGIALAAGLASGHAVVPLAGALAFKVGKERGKTVLAHALYQAAERGTLARLVAKTDEQIARASKGLITAPEKGIAKASEVMPPPKYLATKALARVAAFQANPDDFVDHASQQVEGMASHSPEIASAIVQRQVQAMTFLSSKVPNQGEPDPLDPHQPLRLTPSEEAKLGRYAWYTERPERFFAEVARGKLTPEGAETAQVLMPRAFADLQAQTFEALTTQLARGNRLPFRQREILGQLLDFAATPNQRPAHRTFLQQNVSDVPLIDPSPIPPPKKRGGGGGAGGAPAMSSSLDRLERGGAGRR